MGAQKPPCSGECLIMGGASDAWVSYDQSTARSILFQLRAFAAFNPHALPNACGSKGVMLRFGGMTLESDGQVNCQGSGNWGQTGASCTHLTELPANFHDMVILEDDDTFFAQVGPLDSGIALTLQTEDTDAFVEFGKGVTLKEKIREPAQCAGPYPQPTLNIEWRCESYGMKNKTACLSLVPELGQRRLTLV